MRLLIRWQGSNDPVKIEHIRQVPGVSGVATAVKAGSNGLIAFAEIMTAKETVTRHGLRFELIESLDVGETIKLGLADRDQAIACFQENIRRYAAAGIRVIVYNFRPLFRWARTELERVLPDGSMVTAYDCAVEAKLNPFVHDGATSEWHRANSRFVYEKMLTTNIALEGYYTKDSKALLNELLAKYQQLTPEGFWTNLKYFLDRVLPVAEENQVKLAIHPDDPPWTMYGVVPRLIVDEQGLDRVLSLHDSPANCITLCTGTLGGNIQNDVVAMAKKYCAMDRVPFVHLRNVKRHGAGALEECAHYSACGSLDMVELTKALYDHGFDGYIRPDHGRRIWDEPIKTGDGLYDRALGAQYILGIWETLSKLNPSR